MTDRINARLPTPLAQHVSRIVGSHGLYETPSEYVRSLIRQDMESETYQIYNAIIEGFEDMEIGAYFKGTGDFKKDLKILAKKEAEGW